MNRQMGILEIKVHEKEILTKPLVPMIIDEKYTKRIKEKNYKRK
jgi:hypothetical protein